MATFNDDDLNYEDSNPPEESSNRTFLFAAGGLGLLVLLALLCLGAYVLFSMNSNQTAEQTAIAQATQQAATIQAGLTQTAVANELTATAGATNTLPPTNTPVVAQATDTPGGTPGAPSPTPNAPATATVGAAFTQIANTTQTFIPTSTALPNTGFADEVGIPSLFFAALALMAIIFLVRRLRVAPTR
ncbi:MAG: hypothetical protein MHPDNHAH_00499 [Anaerolineales bacterium]|nr:hypothetical protein [Anaerolineales bacterium]WKZ43122.1 MAG: hypothetical protein QY302_13555 [Anaerolineales bacterium]WKZ49450.1 MAG: hypothetical protein QY306_08770 [Anaerolineales bacterium]